MSFAESARPAAPSRSADPPESPRPQLRICRVDPRDDVCASASDGACVSAMVGLGETYFAAFALALGVGQTLAGLVATIPMLGGASLQLATPWFLRRVRSYKYWVVLFASLQATALLCMTLAAAFSGIAAASWIFLSACVYWAASQATGPAWNTWIEDIVPPRIRSTFFARRARICQISTLAGFLVGGLMLQAGSTSGWLLSGFVAVFFLGAAARFLSAWFLSRQSEPSRGRYRTRQQNSGELLNSAESGSGGSLVIYLLAMQVGVQISGPYFAPFMLAQQKLSYLNYILLIGMGFFGKVVALPVWGHVARQFGARRLLSIGGACIIPVAALWLSADWFAGGEPARIISIGPFQLPVQVSPKLAYLAAVQITSGCAWAAYELATQLMFIEAIPRADRPKMLTLYNFGNAVAQVAGGLIGAAILQLGGESYAAYLALFAASSIMRLCAFPLLYRVKEASARRIERPEYAGAEAHDRAKAA